MNEMSITIIDEWIMDKKIIYQNEAIKLLEAGEDIAQYEVKFNDEKIEALQAIQLGKNKIIVPEKLIYYDDDAIDFSDDPDITTEDIESGKIKWICKAEIPLHKEIDEWIKREKIDLNKLLANLVENFYQTVKNIHKSAAL